MISEDSFYYGLYCSSLHLRRRWRLHFNLIDIPVNPLSVDVYKTLLFTSPYSEWKWMLEKMSEILILFSRQLNFCLINYVKDIELTYMIQ